MGLRPLPLESTQEPAGPGGELSNGQTNFPAPLRRGTLIATTLRLLQLLDRLVLLIIMAKKQVNPLALLDEELVALVLLLGLRLRQVMKKTGRWIFLLHLEGPTYGRECARIRDGRPLKTK